MAVVLSQPKMSHCLRDMGCGASHVGRDITAEHVHIVQTNAACLGSKPVHHAVGL